MNHQSSLKNYSLEGSFDDKLVLNKSRMLCQYRNWPQAIHEGSTKTRAGTIPLLATSQTTLGVLF